MPSKYKGEIQFDSWSWGASNAQGAAIGGTGVGNASAQDFQFTSKIDKAVVKLRADSVMGKTTPKAVLTAHKPGAERHT
jgi:type VI secretion system secreted protein Hcp